MTNAEKTKYMLSITKDRKDKLQALAKREGETMNALINRLIQQEIDRIANLSPWGNQNESINKQ